MGTDTDNESSNPEIQPLAEFDPDKEQASELDERDIIEPLKKTIDETDDQQPKNDADTPEDEGTGEQEVSLDEIDGQAGSDDKGAQNDEDDETEIRLDTDDEEINEQPALDDPPEPNSEEEEISLEASSGDPGSDDEVVSEDKTTDTDKEAQSADDPPEAPVENNNENDFVALDDDEGDDGIDVKPQKEEKADGGNENQENAGENQADKIAAKDKDPGEIKKVDKNADVLSKTDAISKKGKKSAKDPATSQKVFVTAFIICMVAGAILYSKPALFGLKEKRENVISPKAEIEKPVKQAQKQTQQPEIHGKNDRYLSKLAEANRLREELLAKKEEIYRLKLHYRNGIAELKEQIYREMRDANIFSYEQALKNRRLELKLRTIQRRQVYIQELEKPDQWVHNGSEELLFLQRKTLIDIEIAEIASGIDMGRHMRYINAALQKYQPSADKLAVDPPPAELTPLETVWSQIRDQQTENIQRPLGSKNENIIAEICSGDFRRIAELTAITPKAARCLARKDGSELFLNGLTQLNPQEAKNLFKWSGNWICLNGVKKLSPAAGKYLFKWEGNWISLNGLTELPPELALYLTEWKGSQLELMGLNYEKSRPDQRALKYLALWETMGGKLFISDDIRNQMEQVM